MVFQSDLVGSCSLYLFAAEIRAALLLLVHCNPPASLNINANMKTPLRLNTVCQIQTPRVNLNTTCQIENATPEAKCNHQSKKVIFNIAIHGLNRQAEYCCDDLSTLLTQQSGLLLDEPRKSTSFQNLLCISFVKKIKSSIYFNVRFKGFVLLSFAKPTQLSFPPIAKQLTLKAPFVHKNDHILSQGIWISFFLAERFPILTWRFANSHFIHLPSYQNIFKFRPHHIQSLSKSTEPPLREDIN